MADLPMVSSRQGRVFLGVCFLALISAGYMAMHWHEEKTDDAAIEAHIAPMASKVGGYVQDVKVEDNQQVKKGDILLQIDPTDYQIVVERARAAVAAADARLDSAGKSLETTKVTAPSGLASARSQVASAKALWEKAKADLDRQQNLTTLARSQQKLNDAQAAEIAAHSAYQDAEARLRSAQMAPQTVAAASAQVRELRAALARAEADLSAATNDLETTTIKAPFDGRVTKRGVEVGQFLAPGQQTMAIVSNEKWVVANFRETQLEKMRPGQDALITIDAFPDVTYRGHVDSIQTGSGARFSMFPPENATGNFVKIVQRVPVKIVFDDKPDDALPLGPGFSVVPVVMTK